MHLAVPETRQTTKLGKHVVLQLLLVFALTAVDGIDFARIASMPWVGGELRSDWLDRIPGPHVQAAHAS